MQAQCICGQNQLVSKNTRRHLFNMLIIYKILSENHQTKQLKMYPHKSFENSVAQIIENITNLPISRSTFEAMCNSIHNTISRPGALFLWPVFRTLWGVPRWTDFGFPWGTLGLIFFGRFRSNVAPTVKHSNVNVRYFENKWRQSHLQRKSND